MQTKKNDKEERRQIQLQKKRERSRSNRINETEEQRQNRLQNERKRRQSSRIEETEEQRQYRLLKDRERTQSSRKNELEVQRQIRLEQQNKRSQMNRTKKKFDKQKNENISTRQGSILSSWPGPIPSDLKDTRLQQFLEQMSMSKLAEATCAVCNIRAPEKDSKKIPISKIPNIHLLKLPDELKDLIKSLSENTSIFNYDNNMQTITNVTSILYKLESFKNLYSIVYSRSFNY